MPQAPVHGCCGLHQSHQTTEQLATKSKSILGSSFQPSARRPRPFDSQCAVSRRRRPRKTERQRLQDRLQCTASTNQSRLKTNHHLCNTPPSPDPTSVQQPFSLRLHNTVLRQTTTTSDAHEIFCSEGGDFFLFSFLFFFFGSGFLSLHDCRTWSEAGGVESL